MSSAKKRGRDDGFRQALQGAMMEDDGDAKHAVGRIRAKKIMTRRERDDTNIETSLNDARVALAQAQARQAVENRFRREHPDRALQASLEAGATFERLRTENTALKATVAQQATTIVRLERENAALQRANAALRRRHATPGDLANAIRGMALS